MKTGYFRTPRMWRFTLGREQESLVSHTSSCTGNSRYIVRQTGVVACLSAVASRGKTWGCEQTLLLRCALENLKILKSREEHILLQNGLGSRLLINAIKQRSGWERSGVFRAPKCTPGPELQILTGKFRYLLCLCENTKVSHVPEDGLSSLSGPSGSRFWKGTRCFEGYQAVSLKVTCVPAPNVPILEEKFCQFCKVTFPAFSCAARREKTSLSTLPGLFSFV